MPTPPLLGSRRPRRAGGLRPVRSDLWAGLAATLAGLPAGVVWRELAARAVDASSRPEGSAAVDSVLALVMLAVGVGAAVALLARPGPVPARRLAVVLVGLVAGGALAWGTGLVLGVVALGAVGAAFVAAPVTAVVVLVVGLVRYAVRPWEGGGPR